MGKKCAKSSYYQVYEMRVKINVPCTNCLPSFEEFLNLVQTKDKYIEN